VFEADLKIFHDILFAVDDKDVVLNIKEFLKQPHHRIEVFGAPTVPPP
jgi:hypothetical protein